MTSSPTDTLNAVHRQWNLLDGRYDGNGPVSPGNTHDASPARLTAAYGACLYRLGAALGWSWDARQLEEALPYAQDIQTLNGFRAVAQRLGCATLERKLCPKDVPATSLPCLVETSSGPVLFLGFNTDGAPRVEAPGPTNVTATLRADRRYRMCFLARKRNDDVNDAKPWLKRQMAFLKRPILTLAGLSLLINLIALGTPLFTMAVYDLAVRSGSFPTLVLLFVAAVLGLMAELRLRRERTALVAEAGSRFDVAMSASIFQRLLDLPLRMTESAPVSQQILRFRQFESIRAIFTGHIVNAILDLPFLILMIAVIFMLAGPVGFVPLCLAALYALGMLVAHPVQAGLAARDAQARAALQSAETETVAKLASIQQLGIQAGWSARIGQLAAESSEARFRLQLAENALHAATHAMMLVAGISVLGIGASLVLAGSMSVGALVATMMLIWRVMSPIQVVCISSMRISQFFTAIRQVNQIMAMTPEKRAASPQALRRKLLGAIRLEGVSYRHTRDAEPALRGVSLSIPPGQVVAITGPTASGKSTLLKCLAGIYEPATGGIYVDGLNLRQMRVADYRTVIGYLPPRVRLFHGSVLQNLRLIAPGVGEAELRDCLARAGVDLSAPPLNNDLSAFAKGFGQEQIEERLQLQIFLAGLYARRPPILLLDEPGAFLDSAGDARLRAELESLKGRVTVILVTNRPSHLRLCDRVIAMKNGVVALDGPPDRVIAAMNGPEPKRRPDIPTAA